MSQKSNEEKTKEEDAKRFDEECEFLQMVSKLNKETEEKTEWDNWKPVKDIK